MNGRAKAQSVAVAEIPLLVLAQRVVDAERVPRRAGAGEEDFRRRGEEQPVVERHLQAARLLERGGEALLGRSVERFPELARRAEEGGGEEGGVDDRLVRHREIDARRRGRIDERGDGEARVAAEAFAQRGFGRGDGGVGFEPRGKAAQRARGGLERREGAAVLAVGQGDRGAQLTACAGGEHGRGDAIDPVDPRGAVSDALWRGGREAADQQESENKTAARSFHGVGCREHHRRAEPRQSRAA